MSMVGSGWHAGPPGTSPPGSADSLEVRWIVPGLLETAMREWFGRFPARTEAREDAYLLQPRLRGLSVKLRDAVALDVKSYLGSPGILSVPHRGRLESWRKWSFPCGLPGQDVTTSPGWIVIRKIRHSSWFPLAAGQDLARSPKPAAQTGCMVELSEVRVRAQPWWSVGFEAAGFAGLLSSALRHAADLVFAEPLPPGVDLSLDNSMSYAQWLCQQPT